MKQVSEGRTMHTNYTPWSHQHQQTIKSWLNSSWELCFFHWQICNHIIDAFPETFTFDPILIALSYPLATWVGLFDPILNVSKHNIKEKKKQKTELFNFKVSGTLLARVTLLHLYTLRKQQGCVRYNKSSSKTNALTASHTKQHCLFSKPDTLSLILAFDKQ